MSRSGAAQAAAGAQRRALTLARLRAAERAREAGYRVSTRAEVAETVRRSSGRNRERSTKVKVVDQSETGGAGNGDASTGPRRGSRK